MHYHSNWASKWQQVLCEYQRKTDHREKCKAMMVVEEEEVVEKEGGEGVGEEGGLKIIPFICF